MHPHVVRRDLCLISVQVSGKDRDGLEPKWFEGKTKERQRHDEEQVALKMLE